MRLNLLSQTLFTFMLSVYSCSDNASNPAFDPPFTPPDYYWQIDIEPAWSPDGSAIIYFSSGYVSEDSSEAAGLYLIDQNGENKRLFLEGYYSDPDWSPDGNWIVFTDTYNTQVYKINTSQGNLTQLTNECRNWAPDWSPHGDLILLNIRAHNPPACSMGVWSIDTDGNNRKMLFYGGGDPDWSPQGNKIVMTGKTENDISGILISNDIGKDEKLLIDDTELLDFRNPVFSPNKDVMAFNAMRRGEILIFNIWVINSDGSHLEQLTTEGGESPSWSPDGARLVYTNLKEGNGRLWIMNEDGSEKHQLTF
jgi:TolB protein